MDWLRDFKKTLIQEYLTLHLLEQVPSPPWLSASWVHGHNYKWSTT